MNGENSIIRVYVGLGSNLEEPVAQINSALMELDTIEDTQRVAYSSLYQSSPLGDQDHPIQPDFINAVAALGTTLPPHELLHALQTLEQSHGREPNRQKWGPRTLDIDILLYGDEILDDGELIIPHPGLPKRNFVLYPLFEIAPELEIPGNGALEDLMRDCPIQDLKML